MRYAICMASARLVPGHIMEAEEQEEVELGVESEEEDVEEEEAIVLVELTGLPNPDAFLKCKRNCSILGIDTDEPILQLDDYVFKGKFEDIVGTCMFFKQNKGEKELEYHGKTMRKLNMSRVILKKKSAPPDSRTD